MSIRLIADENISWRLKKILVDWDILPANEIIHVLRLSDKFIWDLAKEQDYSILTFDEDFIDLLNLYSYPPKVIWLRIGNSSTKIIAETLLSFKNEIEDFLSDDELGVYEIYL